MTCPPLCHPNTTPSRCRQARAATLAPSLFPPHEDHRTDGIEKNDHKLIQMNKNNENPKTNSPRETSPPEFQMIRRSSYLINDFEPNSRVCPQLASECVCECV